MPEIKKVKIGESQYDIAAKYLLDSSNNLKSYQDILDLIEAGFDIVVLTELPTANASAYATYKNNLVFVPNTGTGTNTYDEYVIQRSGTEGSYTYRWEKIGSTDVDLSGYVQKGVTYAAAAQSAGAHTHTVTVPTVTVDATKKLGATATGTAVGADGTDTFVKSYPGVTSKLVTSTASKATAGTAKTVATNGIKSASMSTATKPFGSGGFEYVESVGESSLTGTTTFNTDAIKDASLTGTTTFAVQPTVDANGVLEFTTSSVGISTTAASTGTVGISSGAVTTMYGKVATTASDTDTITPYSFEDVTVATGALAANGSGDSVMTGLGTAVTADALTSVKVTAQPTITITESTTNTGPVNEHTTTSTASATTSSDGAHTHDLNVPNA